VIWNDDFKTTIHVLHSRTTNQLSSMVETVETVVSSTRDLVVAISSSKSIKLIYSIDQGFRHTSSKPIQANLILFKKKSSYPDFSFEKSPLFLQIKNNQ